MQDKQNKEFKEIDHHKKYEKIAEQMENVTFHPKINPNTKKWIVKKDQNLAKANFMERLEMQQQKREELMRELYQKEAEEVLTFKPKILKYS